MSTWYVDCSWGGGGGGGGSVLVGPPIIIHSIDHCIIYWGRVIGEK